MTGVLEDQLGNEEACNYIIGLGPNLDSPLDMLEHRTEKAQQANERRIEMPHDARKWIKLNLLQLSCARTPVQPRFTDASAAAFHRIWFSQASSHAESQSSSASSTLQAWEVLDAAW